MSAFIPEQQDGRCARCSLTGPVFTPDDTWGKTKGALCARCWSATAEARANGTYTDWHDAFDNATDDELENGIRGEA